MELKRKAASVTDTHTGFERAMAMHPAAKDTPMGCDGDPNQLGVLAVFLGSPFADHIIGADSPLDGGLRRHTF